MTDRSQDDRASLAAALESLRTRLAGLVEAPGGADAPFDPPVAPESTLARVRDGFALTPFELGVVLLGAAVELLPGFDRLCAELSGRDAASGPSLALALAVFPDGDWASLTPTGALRRHRLIVLDEGPVLMQRGIRLDERVLHALLGEPALDARLARRSLARHDDGPLPATHEAVARALEPHRLAHLAADDLDAAVAVAVRGAALRGQQAYIVASSALPVDPLEREELAQLWGREARLGSVALIVRMDHGPGARETEAWDFLVRTEAPWVLVSRDAPTLAADFARLRVPPLSFDERLTLWREALGERVPVAAQRDIAAQFNLGPLAIRAAARTLPAAVAEPRQQRAQLWTACRAYARPKMADLAQRVHARPRAQSLVLPAPQRAMLDALVSQVRRRATVHHAWGFAEAEGRGGGTSAVFAGPSGTGKTMAAEALAHQLDLDLYRIDLSSVVSKYIGETEENLRRVFDAAEAGGAILLFDEADALFGKRTEVRDSHDRHANIEVSYLLQRMEAYCGLAILTTNMRKALDDAFLRRVQVIIDFPFPDAPQRQEIWRGVFPPQTPCNGLNFELLARLSIAGGNIKSIARNAAYLAADKDRPVGMPEVLAAARLEYAKLGRSLAPSELRGWAA